MKKLLKQEIKKQFDSLISRLAFWIPIILVMCIFIIFAGMTGKLIGKNVWIVFAADALFFYLLWKTIALLQKGNMGIKEKILISVTILLLIFIAFATLGVAMITEERIIINMIIFPLGSAITVVSYAMKGNKHE